MPSLQRRLRLQMNAGTLYSLPAWSAAPAREGVALAEALKAAGFHGLQGYSPDEAILAAGLDMSGMAQIRDPADIDKVAARQKAWGFVATTLHLGMGLETETELDRYAAATIEAAARHDYPLYVETHRGTMTQDMRRTLDLIGRFPDLRLNADLSHWYTGQEMSYGDIQARFDILAPVFARVGYFHGRIGDNCCIQTPLTDAEGDEIPSVAHFRDMWTRCFRGFLTDAAAGRDVIFTTELLPNVITISGYSHRLNYARLRSDGEEETDRWLDSIALCRIATECFDTALQSLPAGTPV